MEPAHFFGTWVKRRRRALGLTQEELARQTAYAIVTIRKIESGDLRPSVGLAQKLAEALSIPREHRAGFLEFARNDAASAWPGSAMAGALSGTSAHTGPSLSSPPFPAGVEGQALPEFPLPSLPAGNGAAPASDGSGADHSPGSTGQLDRVAASPLIGRNRELTQIAGYWREVEAGAGRAVLLSGEPGIGKTRLVREIETRVAVRPRCFLRAECYPDAGPPYAALGQMIAAAVAVPDSPEAEATFSLPPGVLADLRSLAPQAACLLPVVAPNARLEPAAEQARSFDSVASWCQALAARGPLLLVLEDAHWADSGMLALWRHLVRRLRRSRALLLATYRDTEVGECPTWQQILVDLNRERLAEQIALKPLDVEGTRALLAALFHEEITPEFLAGIYRQTEGNAFFVEEVVKALIEDGQLCFDGRRWHRPPMEDMLIPHSIRLAIEDRVRRLPQASQDLLRTAALIGREFELPTVQAAAELDEETLIVAVERAERSQIIAEVRGASPVLYRFAHALIVSALSESLSGVRRQRVHRRIAQAIEQSHPGDHARLALHHRAAGNAGPARASYRLAGDQAAAVFAYEEAEEAYVAALELGGDPAERGALHQHLMGVLTLRARYDDATAAGRAGLSDYTAAGDAEGLAATYLKMARIRWLAGDGAGHVAICREALATAAGEARTGSLAELLAESARALFFAGAYEEARPLAEQGLRFAGALDLPLVRAEILASTGMDPGASPDEQRRALEEAVALAAAGAAPAIESRARNNLGAFLLDRGELPAAVAQFDLAARLARAMRSPALELKYLAHKAFALEALGCLDEVEAMLPAMHELSEQMDDPGIAAHRYNHLVAAFYRMRGDLERAAAMLETEVSALRRQGNLYQLLGMDVLLGDVFLELGRLPDAARTLEEAAPLEERFGTDVEARTLLVILHVAEGRLDEAEQVLARVRQMRRLSAANSARVWRAVASVAQARGARHHALAACRERADALHRSGERWELARAQSEWAAMLLAGGVPGEYAAGVELLQRACAIFVEVGASHYANRTRAALAAAGAGTGLA